MEFLWFGVFVLGFIGVIWWFSRSMTNGRRNEGPTHGGGRDEMNSNVDSVSNDY